MVAVDSNQSLPLSTLTTPAGNAAAVTPSDSASLSNVTRAPYIGVTGNIKVTMYGGPSGADQAVTFENVPVGFLPIRVSQVWSTNTTASQIIALW